MAYNGIHTVPLLERASVNSGSAGGTSLSDAIDLRDICRQGNFSVTYRVGQVGATATAGTVNFTYLISATQDGLFVTPTNGDGGTIGTAGSGAAGSCGALSFSPVIAPWMKIKTIAGTSALALVTSELNVQ